MILIKGFQTISHSFYFIYLLRSNHESSCSKFSDNLKAQVTENKEQLTSLTNIIQTLVDQERAAGAELAEVSESAASRLGRSRAGGLWRPLGSSGWCVSDTK